MAQTATETNIRHGDCVELLQAMEPGSARLIFADPPFNLNRGYDYTFNDNRPADEYLAWLHEWLSLVPDALTDDGSFWLAINEKWVAEAKIACVGLGLTLRNWIVWHYSFGQSTKAKFSKSNTHILYFTKHPTEFVFNDMATRIPSLRQIEYGDKRANPDGKVPDATWSEFPRVCGTFGEKQVWHDNQMPEALLLRIIRTVTEPGDLVLDPFSGTATTIVAAERLGRVGRGFEISESYALLGQQRVDAAVADPENTVAAKGKWGPFHVETAEWLLRETGTSSKRIIDRPEALECFTRLLNARCAAGAMRGPRNRPPEPYTVAEVEAALPSIDKKVTSRFVP